MSFPNHQWENLLTEIQTILQTYEPTGYFSLAKVFKMSEDEINLDKSQTDDAQGKNAVFYLIPMDGRPDESFYEDFRIYSVQILFKFNELSLIEARKKQRRIFDAIRDVFWRQKNRQPVGTYFYNLEQVENDNFNPPVSDMTKEIDGKFEKDGKKFIHRGSQTWDFYTCIDHQAVNLADVKSGTAVSGERI